MSNFKWKKTFLKGHGTLKIIPVIMKEFVHLDYDITGLKTPCWLVFQHKETKDFCCIGEIKEGQKTLKDVVGKSQKTIIRSYIEWDEIVTKYLCKEELSPIEVLCAEEILETNETGDLEWEHLKRYWKSMKE
ncbi:MAG: hypothetical protein CMO44_17275 [Verrucomicrobiales bacterium]|nr:hypothetical protein [Verrucomicrobiales bacterium]